MEILLLFFFLLLLLLGEAEKNGNWHPKPSDNFGEMGAWGLPRDQQFSLQGTFLHPSLFKAKF